MTLTRALLSLAVAALLIAPTAGPAQEAGAQESGAQESGAQSGASGIGDSYWPLDGNGGLDVVSYRIDNRYDFGRSRLSGRTAIRMRATQDLTSFSLDFLLPVRSVRVDGAKAAHSRSGGGHELRITPARPLARGSRHTVVVSYAGRPARHRYAGERNWLADKHEVVTMNEPHMAPWWFPANDHPTDKALMDISVTVPRGKQVVANGTMRSRKVGRRTTTWRWRADEPMATYLAFFAAGDFWIKRGTRDGTPWLVAVSERLAPGPRKASMRLMRKTPRILAALEKDLGDYPFSVTGGLTTSLDPGFALENQTRPTYPAVGAHYEGLVVHELAHQWFGNDVSVQRWRDIWLNEGFASFMEWRWAETNHGLGADRMLELAHDSYPAASGFWKVSIADPGPSRVFDQAVYERGAMTVQALRNRVGESTFWQIVRTWLRDNAGGNATSEEFEALAARLSGQDLSAFFTTWLRTPAKPAGSTANGLR